MRSKRLWLLIAIMMLLATMAVVAQQRPSGVSPAQAPEPGRPIRGRKPRRVRGRACWEQAGVPKNVIAQRKSIQESTRSQIQAVCSDSSIPEQQKMAKIRDIRKSAREQMAGLLTPEQRDAVKECQAERGHGMGRHPSAPRGGNPCAEFGR